MMLDPTDDLCRILCTDALYKMDRIEEAHKMLSLALNSSSQKSAVLVRLALLQLKKGFIYDGNQLFKKVIQLGDTSCLLPLMNVFTEEDRRLMQSHCHTKGMSILQSRQGEAYLKEGVAYLSFAIIVSGGEAKDSLLARGRCYGQLGQKKTAIYDFSAVLRVEPTNVEALCAKGFMQMSMNQKKEAVSSVTLALRSDAAYVAREIQSLQPEARSRIIDWLHDHCRSSLIDMFDADRNFQSELEIHDLELIAATLVDMENAQEKIHLLRIDVLIAKENHEEAFTHLKKSFTNSAIGESAKGRYGILHVKCRNVLAAAQELCTLAGTNPTELRNLVKFLDKRQRQSLSQVMAWGGGGPNINPRGGLTTHGAPGQ
ncbi:unnamed protein product [Staurois parvus]|uniref:Tetratricopeptide repeat domain 34 n=1 Tax=Staurois parvus TaxID=386267 RepID=A0ABN9E8E8_9NEOB|nr:unnamed protein product [Staurois parvus]